MARESYKFAAQQRQEQGGIEQLQSRTLHVKGIPMEDRMGVGLQETLNTFLKSQKGKVLAI